MCGLDDAAEDVASPGKSDLCWGSAQVKPSRMEGVECEKRGVNILSGLPNLQYYLCLLLLLLMFESGKYIAAGSSSWGKGHSS